jgi:futalosine hydrolase
MDPDLLILCATRFESAGFLEQYPARSQTHTRTGLGIISGRVRHKTYDLVITGPGVFNAAHAVTVYLEKFSPALILQVGIAGVFRETGAGIGDVAMATSECYIHTGVCTDTLKNDPLPFGLIDADPLTGQGKYRFDPDRVNLLYEQLSQVLPGDGVRLIKGGFITVSAVTSSFEQAEELYAAFTPVMEAMEGAASAHVASLYHIPMVEVRSASNFVGERDKSKWDMDLAIQRLGMVISLI